MRYYLKEIGSDWNEVLDDYLEQKQTNKKLTWHDWYVATSERRKRITSLFNELEAESQSNNEITRWAN